MSRKEARESVMCFLFQNTFIDKYDSSIEDRIDNYISFRDFDSDDIDFMAVLYCYGDVCHYSFYDAAF